MGTMAQTIGPQISSNENIDESRGRPARTADHGRAPVAGAQPGPCARATSRHPAAHRAAAQNRVLIVAMAWRGKPQLEFDT